MRRDDLDAVLAEQIAYYRARAAIAGRVFEAEVVADRRLPVVDVGSAVSDPVRSARTALSPLAACDTLAVHFNVDLVDFLDAPLAENTDRGAAPSLSACGDIPNRPRLTRSVRTRARRQGPFRPANRF